MVHSGKINIFPPIFIDHYQSLSVQGLFTLSALVSPPNDIKTHSKTTHLYGRANILLFSNNCNPLVSVTTLELLFKISFIDTTWTEDSIKLLLLCRARIKKPYRSRQPWWSFWLNVRVCCWRYRYKNPSPHLFAQITR